MSNYLLYNNTATERIIPMSEVISFIRFPLICLVVCIHSSVASEYAHPDSTAMIEGFISSNLPLGAVPTFFFISGYLFFHNGFSLQLYKSKLRSRFYTLLIPYLLWSLIAFAILSIKYLPQFESYFQNLHKVPYNLSLFLLSFIDRPVPEGVVSNHTPLLFPLWYVRDLMCFVLISPIIHALRKYALWVIAFLTTLFTYMWIEKCEFQFYSLLFFVMGAYYKKGGISIIRGKYIATYTAIIISLCLILTIIPANQFLLCIRFLTKILSVPCFLIIATYLVHKRKRISGLLSRSVFFIFCFHAIYLDVYRMVFFKLLHVHESIPVIVMYFISLVSTILISIGIFILMERFAPQYLSILTGGRK